jgi:hypothetical protein
MTALPAAVTAQTGQDSLPVSIGQKVTVTASDGRIIKGTVSALTPQAIELAGTRITVSDVRRVQERDSLANGAGTGALVLGLLGALAGIAGDSVYDSIGGSLGGSSSNGSGFLFGTMIGLASGAAIGAALDASHQKTIYERRDTKMVVAVRPIVSAAGKGLGVQVRW